MRRRLLMITTLLLSMPTLLSAEVICFDVIRRAYPPERHDETGELNPIYDMQEEIWISLGTPEVRHGIDEESGKRYVERTRIVSLEIDNSGKFLMKEGRPENTTTTTEFIGIRSLEFNYFEQAVQTHNPALAFYPHVYFDRRFEAVLGRDHPFLETQETEPDTTYREGPNFSFTTKWRPELGLVPEELLQHHLETGALVKRTRFDDWKQMPDGSRKPGLVHIRTMKGEVDFPVAEAIFKLRENGCPELEIPVPGEWLINEADD